MLSTLQNAMDRQLHPGQAVTLIPLSHNICSMLLSSTTSPRKSAQATISRVRNVSGQCETGMITTLSKAPEHFLLVQALAVDI